jgi:ion channel
MTAMELLAVWLCVSIAIARPGEVYMWLRKFGKRRNKVPERHALLTSENLYEGVVSYGFTIYYFAFIYFVVYRFSPGSFDGVKATSPIGILWAFTYYSVVTITTLGYGDIVPRTPMAQAATVIELFAGFFFVVFLFGAFVSYQVSRLR